MTNRPQTVRERVLSLLSAIKCVTIELPTIEQDTLVRLVDPAAEKQVAVLSVQFLPDEDMMDAETVLKRGGDADERRRLAFGRILAALQGEARS